MGGDLLRGPGQQIVPRQLELCQPVAMLRRPFSLAGRGHDSAGNWIDVIHRVVGVGTRWLGDLQEGDAIDLIGPLGNCFELPTGKSIGLLVGGGVGLPPMFYLAKAMATAGWGGVGLVGARSADLLAVTIPDPAAVPTDGSPSTAIEEFARHNLASIVSTDDGTLGLHGLITDALQRLLINQSPAEARQSVIYTCGPEPMMRSVARLAAQYEIDAQACLEQAMACGMGTCQSCIVQIESQHAPHGTTAQGRPWRYRLACTDGPVFDAANVIW